MGKCLNGDLKNYHNFDILDGFDNLKSIILGAIIANLPT